ncbi:MAG TPA: hypothetical protein VGE31_03305 [Candidatus Paceibacterota bacterium]
MIPNGLVSQIAITVLSAGIIVTYVKPTMDTIGQYQDQIAIYQEERQKVKEVNDTLSTLASRVNSIDSTSQRRLLTYMPDTIDTIGVPRTIEAITLQSGVFLNTISDDTKENGGEEEIQYVDEAAAAGATPDAREFIVSISGTYEQLKEFLRLLEQNEFPLEVVKLEVAQSQPGLLTAELVVRTYSHNFEDNSAAEDNVEQL